MKEQVQDRADHSLVACLTSLGAALYHLGRHGEAVSILQRNLDLEVAEHGPVHVEVGNALYRVGKVLQSQKKNRQALRRYESAIATFESVSDSEKSEYAATLFDAASIRLHDKQPHQAMLLLQAAVRARETAGDNVGVELAEAWQHLGYAHEQVRESSKAREAHQKAFAIYMHHGLEPRGALEASSVASALEREGQCQQALHQYEQSLKLLDGLEEQTGQSKWLRDNVERWRKSCDVACLKSKRAPRTAVPVK